MFGSIYAFTGDGFSHSELRNYVEDVRRELLRLPDVAKIELQGVQDDRIYVEISTKKLASLGIDPALIAQALATQNAMVVPGSVETKDSAVALRVSGQLDSVAAVSGLPLRVAGPNGAQTLRLGDIAAVKRGYADPAVTKMRFGGREAIGLAVSMVGNGDVLQLKSFSRTFMVVLTAPLGVVGVALALLVFRQPFGFVALLGVIALAGMIMRNSVILVDQIEREIDAGSPPWIAIREAAVRRFRPIVLTAAAAVLAMIPLTRSVLWGPMAYSIMGGLILATALTLLFLPALYAAWFRVKRPA